jgi:hypothetical protein
MKENPSESPRILSPVTERDINREANDTELVFSRITHPVIATQLNQLLLEQAVESLRPYKEDTWIPHLPDGWTGEERFKLMKSTRSGAVIDTEELAHLRDMPYPTLESISQETRDRLQAAATVTAIDFTADSPSTEKIGLEWKMPWTGEKPTTKQWSIIESHEKGHELRPYHVLLSKRFAEAFDISAVSFTAEDHDLHKADFEQGSQTIIDRRPEESTDDFGTRYLIEYLFTPSEIAERMSQLKNYFGFSGDETFTKAHLDYARAHYLEDTGMDNSMRLFFEAITPETEAKFIELINSSGI